MIERPVVAAPGEVFRSQQGSDVHLRLCFGNQPEERLDAEDYRLHLRDWRPPSLEFVPDGTFDRVLLPRYDLLADASLLVEIKRVLRPDGFLAVVCPSIQLRSSVRPVRAPRCRMR